MPERWFSDDELAEMSRPTMELASEAIDRGDPETAKQLCEREKHESQFMHDLLVDGMAGLISFVKEKLGAPHQMRFGAKSLYSRLPVRPQERLSRAD